MESLGRLSVIGRAKEDACVALQQVRVVLSELDGEGLDIGGGGGTPDGSPILIHQKLKEVENLMVLVLLHLSDALDDGKHPDVITSPFVSERCAKAAQLLLEVQTGLAERGASNQLQASHQGIIRAVDAVLNPSDIGMISSMLMPQPGGPTAATNSTRSSSMASPPPSAYASVVSNNATGSAGTTRSSTGDMARGTDVEMHASAPDKNLLCNRHLQSPRFLRGLGQRNQMLAQLGVSMDRVCSLLLHLEKELSNRGEDIVAITRKWEEAKGEGFLLRESPSDVADALFRSLDDFLDSDEAFVSQATNEVFEAQEHAQDCFVQQRTGIVTRSDEEEICHNFGEAASSSMVGESSHTSTSTSRTSLNSSDACNSMAMDAGNSELGRIGSGVKLAVSIATGTLMSHSLSLSESRDDEGKHVQPPPGGYDGDRSGDFSPDGDATPTMSLQADSSTPARSVFTSPSSSLGIGFFDKMTASIRLTPAHHASSRKVQYDVESGEFLGDAMDDEATIDERETGLGLLEESHVVSEEDEEQQTGGVDRDRAYLEGLDGNGCRLLAPRGVDQSPSALVRSSIAVSTAAGQHPVVDTAIHGEPPVILVKSMAVPTEDDFRSDEEFTRLQGECSSSPHPKMIVARILAEDQQGRGRQRRIWGNNTMLSRVTTGKVILSCVFEQVVEHIRSGNEREDNEVPIELSESVRSSLPEAKQRDLLEAAEHTRRVARGIYLLRTASSGFGYSNTQYVVWCSLDSGTDKKIGRHKKHFKTVLQREPFSPTRS